MTGTLNPTCPLRGLRFAARPLLELHIREDHRQHGRRDLGDAGRLCPALTAHPGDMT
jgi:hypothetical protein